MQELHTDAPHGPWAFVLSLTPRERAFAGGHTLLMQPRVLNYWPGFDPSAGLEMKHLVRARLAHCSLCPFCCRHPVAMCGVTQTQQRCRTGGCIDALSSTAWGSVLQKWV